MSGLSGPELWRSVNDRFLIDTRNHVMTIDHDHDLYRHIRFRRPDRSMYWFDLVTWPGYLSITGDMGNYTFKRLPDMFQFFRGDRPNPQYWAEKTNGAAHVSGYSPAKLEQTMREYAADDYCDPSVREAINNMLGRGRALPNDPTELPYLMRELADAGATDLYDWPCEDYTVQFLWCCSALPWAIAKYDAAQSVHKAAS